MGQTRGRMLKIEHRAWDDGSPGGTGGSGV
jgi:hypothetical protein